MRTSSTADLSEKQKAGVAAALDNISSDRESDALRTVKVYDGMERALIELEVAVSRLEA